MGYVIWLPFLRLLDNSLNSVGNGMEKGHIYRPKSLPLERADEGEGTGALREGSSIVLSQMGVTTSKKEWASSERELVTICPLNYATNAN